jgi:hypothetical protein
MMITGALPALVCGLAGDGLGLSRDVVPLKSAGLTPLDDAKPSLEADDDELVGVAL